MIRQSFEIVLVTVSLWCFVSSAPFSDNDFNLQSLINHHRLPKMNFDDFSSLIAASSQDDELNKRSGGLWFGPRLGKRSKRSHEDEVFGEYLDEPNESSEKLLDNLKYLSDHSRKFLVDNGRNGPPMLVVVVPETNDYQRIDREAAEKQLKPFPIRYGRQLPPYSPRLGRQLFNNSPQHTQSN